jgi:hypothetical protein
MQAHGLAVNAPAGQIILIANIRYRRAAAGDQAHENGAYLTAHDAIDPMDHAATLAAQHAHHFLV